MKVFIFVAALFMMCALQAKARESSQFVSFRSKRQVAVSVNRAVEKLKLEVQAIIAAMKLTETANLNTLATELDTRINSLLATTTLTTAARSCITALKPTSSEILTSAQASIDKCLADRYALLTKQMTDFATKVMGKFTQIDKVMTCLKDSTPFACLSLITASATEAAIDELAKVLAELFAELIQLVVQVIRDLVQCERVATKGACDALLKKSMDVADCMLLR